MACENTAEECKQSVWLLLFDMWVVNVGYVFLVRVCVFECVAAFLCLHAQTALLVCVSICLGRVILSAG